MSLQKYELFRNPEKSIFQVNDVRGLIFVDNTSIVSAWIDPEIWTHKRDKTRGTQRMRRKWWRGKNQQHHLHWADSTGKQNKVVSVELDGPFSTVCPNQHTHTHTPMDTHSQNKHRQMQVKTHILRHARHYTMGSS